MQKEERNWTFEEALRVVLTPNRRDEVTICYDHFGFMYKNLRAMLSYYDISRETYVRRKKMGWNLERILMTPVVERNFKLLTPP